MAKRFTDTEIWKQDWFLDLPIEYKMLFFYIKDNCDHAGIFKVNLRSFSLLNEVKVDPKTALEYFNSDKERIRVLAHDKWFIEDFICFQYGMKLNINNRVHKSILDVLNKLEVKIDSIRGLKEVNHTLKDKDKDKDKEKDLDNNINNTIIVDFERVDKWIKGFPNEQTFIEGLYMTHKFKKGSVSDLIKLFREHLKIYPANHKNFAEFKTHFASWINVKSRKDELNKFKKHVKGDL